MFWVVLYVLKDCKLFISVTDNETLSEKWSGKLIFLEEFESMYKISFQ